MDSGEKSSPMGSILNPLSVDRFLACPVSTMEKLPRLLISELNCSLSSELVMHVLRYAVQGWARQKRGFLL